MKYEICSKIVGRSNREDIDDACDYVKELKDIYNIKAFFEDKL